MSSAKKRPAPLSIRLTEEERAYLKRKAGKKSVSAYVRDKALGEAANARNPVQSPKVDYEMLGRILGILGKSELSKNLCLLAVAAEHGALIVDEDVEADLKAACADVREIRLLLIRALGLRSP
jgi:hypothetical protein